LLNPDTSDSKAKKVPCGLSVPEILPPYGDNIARLEFWKKIFRGSTLAGRRIAPALKAIEVQPNDNR
jgi:hypothetical protein